MKFTSDKIEHFDSMLVLRFPNSMEEEANKLKEYVSAGRNIVVEIKREPRSLNANAYCWVLCQKIAEKLTSPQSVFSKEDVYREAIRKCMTFTPVPVRNDAVEAFERIWRGHGIGWIVEVLYESKKLKGYTTLALYEGSSVYDSKKMSRLIDYLVSECQELGIQVKTSKEISKMIEEWEKNLEDEHV